MQIFVDPQRRQVVRPHGHLIEASARQETRSPAQSEHDVPCPHPELVQGIVGSIAHQAIDGCAYGLASVVLVGRCADRLVVGELRGGDHDLLPEHLREGADPVAHLVEDLRLDVDADDIARRSGGQLPRQSPAARRTRRCAAAAPGRPTRRLRAHPLPPSGGLQARRTGARPPSGRDTSRVYRWVRCRAWRQSPRVLKSS